MMRGQPSISQPACTVRSFSRRKRVAKAAPSAVSWVVWRWGLADCHHDGGDAARGCFLVLADEQKAGKQGRDQPLAFDQIGTDLHLSRGTRNAASHPGVQQRPAVRVDEAIAVLASE